MKLKKIICSVFMLIVFLAISVFPVAAKKIFIQGELFSWDGELYNITSEWVPILRENQITIDKIKNGKRYTMELFRCSDWGPLKILIEPNLFGYGDDGILIYNIIPSEFISSFIALHSLKDRYDHGKELKHVDTMWAQPIEKYNSFDQERLREEYREGWKNFIEQIYSIK